MVRSFWWPKDSGQRAKDSGQVSCSVQRETIHALSDIIGREINLGGGKSSRSTPLF
jgi:hypothetical protein